MNQLLNNRVGKPPKSERRGCLFLLVGSLLALLATGLFVLAVSYLTGVVIESRHGSETAYALMQIVTPCYGVAMLLFYGILAIWYISPTEDEVKRQNSKLTLHPGQAPAKALSRRTLWLFTAGLLLGVILTGAVCVNTYRLVTPDGIRTYCFVEIDRYEWRQVSAYTIDCDEDDGLSVTFTMRNGKKFEILQGVNSATEKFHDAYSSVTHFASVIDEHMVALQVPRNVRHMERAVRFYSNYEELWPYVSKLIGYTELHPEDDETVNETEAVTDPDATTGTETASEE